MRSAAINLPAPYQPFLVRDDFIVRADLFPLPGTYNCRREERHFELDARFYEYIEEKLAALARRAEAYRYIDASDPNVLAQIYLRLFRTFSREYPELVESVGKRMTIRLLGLEFDFEQPRVLGIRVLPDAPAIGHEVASWLEGQHGLLRLGDALALSCQEDIVIMRLDEHGQHFGEAMHVLLPSTWSPLEKYRQSFAEIHRPVAESERLVASADNVMKAIVSKGPYVRFGLSLTTQLRLDSHPDLPKPWDEAWLDDTDQLAANCFVRVERQTTLPMPDLGRALFSVRIYNTPLETFAFEHPEFTRRLATILRSASPAVVSYKGMAHYVEPVAQWCERRTQTDCL